MRKHRIIYDEYGQTGNRLFSYLDSIGWAIVNEGTVIILFPDKILAHFDRLRNSQFICLPLWGKGQFAWRIVRKLFYYNSVIQKFYKTRLSQKLGFYAGWNLRESMEYYPKVIPQIQELFVPNDDIKLPIDSLFSVLRNDNGKTIIGVHIRRGDYKTAYEGKYARVGKTIYQYVDHRWNATNISVAHSTIPTDGVYIVDKGGQFVKPSLWASSHTATQASGIAVITNGTGFVVAPKARTLSQTMTLTAASSEVTLYDSSSAALSDANGKSNTRSLVSIWGAHATAASYCRSYGFEWGGRGYLPSVQEAKGVLTNPMVSEALAIVNGWQNTDINALATSTMKTPTMVWCVEGASGSLVAHDVADETMVIPLSPLPTVSFSYPYPDAPDTSAAPSDGMIHFADPVVKQVCVELYDTDGDGELSYAEAAAVRDIDYDFANKEMATLDELVYFTQIKNIYFGTFSNCPNLVSVTLPENMSVIWSKPFYNCPKLRYIHVAQGNQALSSDDGVLLNRIRTTLYKCPQAYPGEYVMPSTVMQVQEKAFQACKALTSVDISPECTYIDLDAFAECTALRTVKVHWQKPLVPSSDIFSGVNLANLTLYVPKGKKSAFQAATPWSSFGTIVEYDDPTANAITFADDEVKAVCVEHWDTNGDGELRHCEERRQGCL